MFEKMSRWGVVLAVMMGGCAAYDLPTPGPDHPAHPQAATPHDGLMLSTLEIDAANLPSQPPELKGRRMPSMGDGPMSDSPTSQEQE